MSLSCIVAVDGRRVADSADSYGTRGVALDGLNVRWGRSSRLAQPSPSTCSLRIALPSDRPIGEDLAALAPGARITVTAEQAEAAGASAYETSSPAPLRLTTTAPAFIDPAPLEADGGNPAAWDALPRASRGAVYTARVEIADMPPYTTVSLRPVYYSGPFASARALGPVIASKHTSGPAVLTGRFLPDDAHLGQWVGLAITANPLGPTWRQGTWTWAVTDPKWTFETFGLVLANGANLRREGPASRAATVFSGRITDAPISWDAMLNRPVIDVIAADFTAELANQLVSSTPWPEEPAAARISRILTAARLNFTPQIDAAPGALLLGPRDVDAQSVANLLRAVAASTGAILWPTTHAAVGDFIRLEDLSQRRSLYRLIVPASGPARIETSASGAITVPASQIRRSGLTVQRDTTDLATQVAVRWTETTIDIDGEEKQTDHTETASDAALIARLGTRSLSISTDLARKTDASDLAVRTLARSAPGGFTIPSATWDLKNAPSLNEGAALACLDSASRVGAPIILTGVGNWVPGSPNIPVYLDGGTYTFQRGRWILGLQLTRAAVAGDSITWNQAPQALTWARGGSLTFADLGTVNL